jgi:hypothetical protein
MTNGAMLDAADFQRVQDYMLDVVDRIAMQQRVKCATACGVSIEDTCATVVPDPDKPDWVIITAYPRAAAMVQNDKR